MTRNLLLVFGMGRSGTSALTRVLSLCGLGLPEKLIGASAANLRGHWEPEAALTINERFLNMNGANWFDPTFRLQTEMRPSDETARQFVEQIVAFLKTCPETPTLIVKEPRITALSDYWAEAARLAGFDTKYVIPVRHPAATIASIVNNYKCTPELSKALWLKYNLLAERETRAMPRVFVEYDNLLADWRKEVGRISRALNLAVQPPQDEAIDSFLSHELRHEIADSRFKNGYWDACCMSLYDAMRASAVDQAVDMSLFDEIYARYSESERLFRIALDDFRNSRFNV